MSSPEAQAVLAALEETWPPAEAFEVGPFYVRRGAGGGKRVSAASPLRVAGANDVAVAEAAMRELGQPALFVLRPGDEGLDDTLEARGYRVVDPVTLYARASMRGPVPLVPDLGSAALDAVWAEGGIGPARRAVMDRVTHEKAVLCAGAPGAPEGAVFVARARVGAMLHALHVAPDARRRGSGRMLTAGALAWAADHGAPWVALAVTDKNRPARALYASLGFEPVGRYWYRAEVA